MKNPDLDVLPELPRDGEGPVFAEPWQAQAFAMTLRLHDGGIFTWTEWADALGQEIAAANDRGDPDRGDTYYSYWLSALENLLREKQVVTGEQLSDRKAAWAAAAEAAPHGEPIKLKKLALAAEK